MWVDGVVRVVCGLSEETSCQDVVIALAQAIGEHLEHRVCSEITASSRSDARFDAVTSHSVI